MKLSRRLSLAVTGVSAIALLASFVTVYVSVGHDERADLDLALTVQAQTLADRVTLDDPSLPASLQGGAAVPEHLRPTHRYVAVYTPDGRLRTATKNFTAAPSDLHAFDLVQPLSSEGETFDLRVGETRARAVVVPLNEDGDALLYAVPSRSVDEDTQFLRRVLMLLFASAVLVTWVFSRWLGERLARDVQTIGRVARDVATGDFNARVGGHARGSDETSALASDLDHMIEKLGSLVDSQRVFVAHAAHELRSPLTTLRGELQLLLRRPREVAEYQETIERLLESVESLTQLAEDLLTLARAQTEMPAPGRCSVEQVLNDAMHMAAGVATQQGVTVERDLDNDGIGQRTVHGARNDMARALRNLIDNAITHSSAGQRVVISVRAMGSRVCFNVEDEGPGIDAEDAPHIFEPLYRGAREQSGDRPGAGLGLTIAQQIVRGAGGDVTVDLQRTHGARVVLEALAAHTD